MKIAVGGFHHETNTFALENAEYQNFVEADGWPALTEDEKANSTFPVKWKKRKSKIVKQSANIRQPC